MASEYVYQFIFIFVANMSWSNYHSHSHYCDGKGTLEDQVIAAIDLGIQSFGFSSHCPVTFPNNWSMPMDRLEEYSSTVQQLKVKYANRIQLYHGLEVDFIPGMIDVQNDFIRKAQLDYSVGSVHFVGAFVDGTPWEIDGTHLVFKKGLQDIYGNDAKIVVQKYFKLTRQMIKEACPTIIGHLDKIKMQNKGYWDENSDWYHDEIIQCLELIKASGAILEINTRGIYKGLTSEPYPSYFAITLANELEIPMCLNSDSHRPAELTGAFCQTANELKRIGMKHLWVLEKDIWTPFEFDETGIRF